MKDLGMNRLRDRWAVLTWRGRLDWFAYTVRCWFIKPAPNELRCYMGAPVFEDVWCPRYAVDGGTWCRRHRKTAS